MRPPSLPSLVYAAEAVSAAGINLSTLLRLAARRHPERLALADDHECLRYDQLWRRVEAAAMALHARYGLRAHHSIAIACRNHVAAVVALCAASRLGAHVYLVNPELRGDQLRGLVERIGCDLLVYDDEVAPVVADLPAGTQALPATHPTAPSLAGLAATYAQQPLRLQPAATGRVAVLTSGTTGQPKTAARRPTVLNTLGPFLALALGARLHQQRSFYIAAPIYHGYGLALSLIGFGLAAELHITRRFDAASACALIAREQITAAIVVPLMLQRMLSHDPAALASLRCIIAGSAPLNPALATATLDRLGPILFNLYGTSEAGFALLAPPETLRTTPGTIGKPLPGVRTQLVDATGRPVAAGAVGRLQIRSAWTISGAHWIDTGDLAYRDAAGDMILCGRNDDMIVSGGENVYPIELEHVLLQHPDVAATAAVGIPDAEFGQRLKALIVVRPGSALDEATVRAWLKPRVARYQMPAVVEFRAELPYTALGKLQKRSLL
jgi:acyl-CoA synthetase (AMP-forming)/AMP-acid ligase II